ncbi:DUF2235 domain-containing protein [Pseudomonas aeruginosa]|nr:DUF2235 domain-containing protein [Pseudomonas aeruginosa]
MPPAGSAQDNDAPRQLVVAIDGTSNRFGDQPTNVGAPVPLAVARSAQGAGLLRPGRRHLRPEGNPVRVAKFPSRIAGLAFGWGLKRNVEGAYRFLAEHYRPGDQIFLFGFSRGAYAVRVLAAMLRGGGPDRCAPAAPLRLRLDPAHHPHAAPRRRQAGRHASSADRTSACWDASARSSAGR